MEKKSPFELKPRQLSRLLAIAGEEVPQAAAAGAEPSVAAARENGTPETLPGWIGRYRVRDVLGEGGMGIVYLARQEHPIERAVAVKLIKPGMDSRQIIARFEAERQTLALLDHPNIAHVLDAGTTEDGRPYFVMEYVQGLSITEHCDQRRLTVEERLRLFLQVCEAIQHAHSKGIIHRDIKPSNILVTIRDDKPVPKVIDFGVAKALAQGLTERTLHTRGGQFVGTPEYVSPEQIDLCDGDVDARSDVYSLGVVLYVLLTGVLPFEWKDSDTSGIEQIRRTIREQDPKGPSLRLLELGGNAARVSENRRVDLATLTRTLATGLEWIPLKAMRKERDRRYQSVGELASDIERHLAGAPVMAGRPTLAYRLRKFIRAHRISITGVIAVVIALLAGLYMGRIVDLVNRIVWVVRDSHGTATVGPSPGPSVSGSPIRSRPIVYVDAKARGTADGASWANASTSLQDALGMVRGGDEIWVAQGTYKPDQSRTAGFTGPESSFTLISGVATYGGFPAGGGTWEQRNPALYETILSGDLGVANDPSDNSYHVVMASWTNAETVLDGFTITGGNANGPAEHSLGGGLHNISGHLMVVRCLFTGNAAGKGGGVYNRLNRAKFFECRFVSNVSRIDAGGMLDTHSNVILYRCVFARNTAGRNGGGLFFHEQGEPWVVNCRFEGNSASNGGGVFNHHSACLFFGCIFAGNTAGGYGGGQFNLECDKLVRSINCTFSSNRAGSSGGGLIDTSSPHTVVNCIFWGNRAAEDGPQIWMSERSRVDIHRCCVQDGQPQVVVIDSTLDWRPGNIAADPQFVDANGLDGIAGTDDDRLELAANSPCIDAGDDREVPADAFDADGDGDILERVPLDIAGHPRFMDDADVPDADIADPQRDAAAVDIGAYERRP